ncbi:MULTISPECIES: hypothetical protein [unclassified Campylobacter]|nr:MULTISPECIES: hypothetical protein [unclassified Campylobacter]MDA3047217.1 hypothetical protein [Campylobacter sp. JMF_08 NE1]MDA3076604.1 hypothetical protein [Campylobacter sp. JMF_04 NA10]
MKTPLITMRFIENLKFLQEKVPKENIIFCGDDEYNEFLCVSCGGQIYGVAYFNYGTNSQISLNVRKNLLYIGASQNFICIDIDGGEILFNEELIFPFFEMLYDENSEYLCVVCECNIICYFGSKEVWRVDFGEIINSYEIIDNKLFVKCVDKKEYIISLFNGNI